MDPQRARGGWSGAASDWDTHRTRQAFETDRRRDAALQADGWHVLRFTARTAPHTIRRRLRAFLPG